MVAEHRRIGVTPHVAQDISRVPGGSANDEHTTRRERYAKSINASRGIKKVYELRSTPSAAGASTGAVYSSSSCVAAKRTLRCMV